MPQKYLLSYAKKTVDRLYIKTIHSITLLLRARSAAKQWNEKLQNNLLYLFLKLFE